jgi:hypothetical protein
MYRRTRRCGGTLTNKKAGTKWSLRIDSHVHRELDSVATDLLLAGPDIVTDGKISVLQLSTVKVPVADKPASAGDEPLH